jgi:hypothetical protein
MAHKERLRHRLEADPRALYHEFCGGCGLRC